MPYPRDRLGLLNSARDRDRIRNRRTMTYSPCSSYKTSQDQRRFLAVALAACWIASCLPAFAADIRVDPSGGDGKAAVLEGKIEAGDFEKLRDFVLKGSGAQQIYLASPGGNLAEAIKLGLFIRSLKLSTIVPSRKLTREEMALSAKSHDLRNIRSDYMCASACFLVFVAGVRRESDHHGLPILGIHRPTILGKDGAPLTVGARTIADAQVRRLVENYLKVMDAPASYVEDMYSTPKETVRWIRNDEFERYFDGFIPELKAIIGAMCASHHDGQRITEQTSDLEHSSDDDSQASDRAREQCEEHFQTQLATNAHDEAVRGPIVFPSSILRDLRPSPAE